MASYSHRPMSRSSGRHHHVVDIMSSTSALLPGGEFVDDAEGPFDVVDTKKAPLEVLLRWRKAVLTLNGSRRFRYTVGLIEELEKDSRRRMIRSRAQVERAALHFKLAAERQNGLITKVTPPTPSGDYGIGLEPLASLTREHNTSALQQYGGVKGISSMIKTNLETGIDGDEADLVHRRNVFGSNTYPHKKEWSFLRFLREAFDDSTLRILIIAAAVSLALGIKTEGLAHGWYDGGSIAILVFLITIVTAVTDYWQYVQFQNLRNTKESIQLQVIRGGRTVNISIFDIVVGDVVPLRIGNQVPADGILITGHSLAIDESSMTGESKIVHKGPNAPFLMSGCKIADGVGTMLVTSVGSNTALGLLMASISEDTSEETPLQVHLNGLATFIGIIGLSVAALVLIILLIRYSARSEFDADKTSFLKAVYGGVKIFTIAVTILVVAVPEWLPLVITLTLAYSMKKIIGDMALVRRLSACETMGSVTTICSGKSGILTLNQMTLVEAYVGLNKICLPDDLCKLPASISTGLSEAIALNTSGNVFKTQDGEVEISGSPTEKAILSWAVKLGMEFNAIRSKYEFLFVFPFNSEKKRSGVAVTYQDKSFIYWMGAAEIVLASCTWYLDSDGERKHINQGKECFKNVINGMAERSLRTVAIATREIKSTDIPEGENSRQWALLENELLLLAVVGIKNRCRPEVKDAVQSCIKAGVKVQMVTGDHFLTAKAIALECGIISDKDATEPNIIEGKTFRELSEKEREECANNIKVMWRSYPNDKLLLVQALRKGADVVAVTGDDTNDAPALHEADIGLSMGIQGTEVAKESSDIIILDDNFASVVKVVCWGRSVYANIQKFIQFQLTANVAALTINVVAAISFGCVPLNAVQLLWVNLIINTLGALALATEPPTDDLMHRTPVSRRAPLITNSMWRNIMVQAVYQIIVLLVLDFLGNSIPGLKVDNVQAVSLKNTLIFNAFVFCQIFNVFNARKPEELNFFSGVTKNYLFMGIIGATFLSQIIIIQFLGRFTKTTVLDWQQWLICFGIAIVSWPLAIVGKLIPVPKTPFSQYCRRAFQPCRQSFKRSRTSRNT